MTLQRNRLSPVSALGRRSFLGAAGVGAAALPFLRTLKGSAQPAGAPQRLLIFFSPNGTIETEWPSAGAGRDFELGNLLEPLEPFRNKLLIPIGIDLRSNSKGPGKIHALGMGHLLTCAELNPGPWTNAGFATSISIDQTIAGAISTTTPFRSLELGVQTERTDGGDVWSRMVYRGNDDPLPPENSPYDAFDRVFAGGFTSSASPVDHDRRRLLRQSVLDSVKDDFALLQSRLGAADRARLDLHLQTIRELEGRLETSGEPAACEAFELGPRMNHLENDNFPDVMSMHMDVITAAFTCDMTRVATLQCSRAIGGTRFTWLPEVEFDHHRLSHKDIRRYRDQYIAVGRWYASKFAELLGKLDSVPEGSGTMLDNTLVVWVNEIKKGVQHSRTDMPFVMAGNVNGQFDMGRMIDVDRTHSDMWLTIARAFGLEIETFGDPDFITGEISSFYG
ncbi:MAG: DUF1552 domain-containing protein [Myxococcota bacterium]